MTTVATAEKAAIGQDLWTEGVHPLINSMDAHLRTWSGWKSQFRQAEFYDYYEMLIRRGFHMDASYEEGVERILFYLRMAEGHCNSRTLEKPEDRSWQKSTMKASWWTERVGTERDWRRTLAHLAYKEFVSNFMRSHESNIGGIVRPDYNPWEEWIVDERVMKAFLHFFRVEGSEMPNFQLSSVNVADKQATKIVADVLVKLSSIRWHVSEDSLLGGEANPNEPLQKLLEQYSLTFLEILFVLKRLNVLGGWGVYVSGYVEESSRLGVGGGMVPKWSAVEFSDAELGKLRELALSERTWTPDMGYLTENDGGCITMTSDPRTPHSIQEALRIGASQAAKIYVLLCDRQGIDWRK